MLCIYRCDDIKVSDILNHFVLACSTNKLCTGNCFKLGFALAYVIVTHGNYRTQHNAYALIAIIKTTQWGASPLLAIALTKIISPKLNMNIVVYVYQIFHENISMLNFVLYFFIAIFNNMAFIHKFTHSFIHISIPL